MTATWKFQLVLPFTKQMIIDMYFYFAVRWNHWLELPYSNPNERTVNVDVYVVHFGPDNTSI